MIHFLLKIITITTLCFPYCVYVYAQPVALTDNTLIGFLQITSIDKENGIIYNAEKSYLKIDMFFSPLPRDYRINDKGDQIINTKKIIQNIKGNLVIRDVPQIDVPGMGSVRAAAKYTSKTDEIILYYTQNIYTNMEASDSLIFGYYNIMENKLLNTFIIKNNHRTEYQISHDGNTILGYEDGHILHLYVKNDEEYIETIHGPYYTSIYPMISQSGNRVFFLMRSGQNEELQWVYLENQSGGWSKEIPIPISPLTVDDQEVKLVHVTGIANDGHTLIVRSDIHNDSTGKYHLAVIHETENGWSKPEYVGDFDYWIENIYNSEDGRVIALQQTKRYSEMYGPLSYDGYVFIRNDEGKWIKNKVNPEGVEVMQSMLLSGDGSTLLWNPSNSLTFPSYPEMK